MSSSTNAKNNGPLVITLVLVILIGLSIAVYFAFFAKAQPHPAAVKPVVVTSAPAPVKPVVESAPAQPRLLGVHRVIPRDTLWWISDKWYKDPVLWPSIYEINLNQIHDPDLIFPGQKLEIPALIGSKDHLSQDDYSLLAKGYLEAYRVYQSHGKKDAQDYKAAADRYKSKAGQ